VDRGRARRGKGMKKRYEATFKARVAIEAIKGEKTMTELASQYKVHPNQISQWRKQALTGLQEFFSDRRHRQDQSHEQLESELYEQIGKLKVELDWLKKKLEFIH
jgi:putative transposase